LSTRRRIYLLRHAEVAYFDEDGQPVAPDEVPLTPAGRHQAERAGAALAGSASTGSSPAASPARWRPPTWS
jgi:broad specificity phosphatase PhoE